MNQEERFEILRHENIVKSAYDYLRDILSKVNIEIVGHTKGILMDLMEVGKLEGWCFQTTETAALFMPDDTIIYRGNLKLDLNKTYYHAFISFRYKDIEYVFDPCLCMINTKKLYFDTFNVDIKGSVKASEVRKYFMQYIENPPKRKKTNIVSIDRLIEELSKYRNKDEVVIHDKEDPNAPMYRNGAGYRDISISDNKIKSLTVHYYMGICI